MDHVDSPLEAGAYDFAILYEGRMPDQISKMRQCSPDTEILHRPRNSIPSVSRIEQNFAVKFFVSPSRMMCVGRNSGRFLGASRCKPCR